MADGPRRRLAQEVRRLREGLAADLEAGISWIPWDGPSPADRLRPAPRAPAPVPRDLPRSLREKALAAVAAEVAACTACRLCRGRTNTVPGEGHPAARVMFSISS